MSWGSKLSTAVLCAAVLVTGVLVAPERAPSRTTLTCPDGAIPYVDEAQWTGAQCLDLSVPTTGDGPFAAVVFVHGGGWTGGAFRSPTGWRKDAAELAKVHGFVAANIEYDRASTGKRRGYLQEPKDVADAVAYVRSLAFVDPDRIGIIGDSAGGHLALLSALRDGGADPVEAVVSWSGPGDLAELTRTLGCGRTACQPDPSPQWPARGAQLFEGSCLADPPLLTTGWRQCTDDRYRTTAPLRALGAGDPAMLLAAATDDPLIPYNQHRALADAARERHVPMREVIVPGGRHGRAMREAPTDPPGLWAAETVPFLVDCVQDPPCAPEGVGTASSTAAVANEL